MSIELLKAARDLIADPAHHTTRAYGRDAAGARLSTGFAPEAVCWCAVGALQCAALQPVAGNWKLALDTLEEAAQDLFEADVVSVNDGRGHGPVMRMYDRAIEMAAT